MPNQQEHHVSVEHLDDWNDSTLIPVKPDLLVPSIVTGTVETWEYPGIVFRLVLNWRASETRYVVVQLQIDSAQGLTTPDLHSFSLPKIVGYLSNGVVLIQMDKEVVRWEDLRSHDEYRRTIKRISSGRLTDEAISFVSRIYSWAKIEGGNPNSRVTSELQIPQRTATRWISRARAEGFID